MRYRRAQTEGGSYFFTVVTDQRRPFLCEPENITLLRSIFREIKKKHPFTIDAAVILPDHLHCLWTLPIADSDYSMRWRLIKSAFSRQCESQYSGIRTKSRKNKKELAVWQRRFWEHQIQNENDYNQHIDYIHYNPVKHGLTDAPSQWPLSSFQHHVSKGFYDQNWGAGIKMKFENQVGQE